MPDISNGSQLKGLIQQARQRLNDTEAAILADDLENTIRGFSQVVESANKGVHAAAGNVNK